MTEAPMWQLAQAKNKVAEVVTKALTEGPQTIPRRGKATVLISKECEQLSAPAAPGTMSLGEFRPGGPSFKGNALSRDRSPELEANFDFGDD
jgi:prevent-host-death family protein